LNKKKYVQSDLVGRWVGKFSTSPFGTPHIDQCWELTKDNRIIVYSVANAPNQLYDYEGSWVLNGNIFKATFVKRTDPSRIYTDSATLVNNYTAMLGTEGVHINASGAGNFFMKKQ